MKTRFLPLPPVARPRPELEGEAIIPWSGPQVAAALGSGALAEFFQRIFSAGTVRSVWVDVRRSQIRIRFPASGSSRQSLIRGVGRALRAPDFTPFPMIELDRLPPLVFSGQYEVWRIGEELSLWRIDRLGQKDFRLRHPLLRNEAVREKVLDRLSQADIVPASGFFHPEDVIVIHCHSPRFDEPQLKTIVDEALEEIPPEAEPESAPRLIPREILLHVNLAVAPLADFVLPALRPASAVMVFLINKEHLPRALAGLRQGRFNFNLVYVTVSSLTILSFEFLAGSSMYWLLHFWPKWTRSLRRKSQRRLLAHYQRLPSSALLQTTTGLVEVGVQDLQPATEILLTEGDRLPGDGVIVEGSATLEEAWIMGSAVPIPKSRGDTLYASTKVLSGKVRLRLRSLGTQTEAAKIAAWHRRVLATPREPRLSEAERFNDGLTLPVLLVGGLAMLRGGVHMAKAVLRPDYRTGPWMTEELVDLQTMVNLAPSGIVVTDPSALDRVASADCAIFDDSVEWFCGSHHPASITQALRESGLREVVFLSEKSGREASFLAKKFGFDSFQAEMNPYDKMGFMIQRRHLGGKLVYFGDCQKEPLIPDHVDVAVSIVRPPYPDVLSTPVAILQPDLYKCQQLLIATRARNKVLKSSLITTLASNLSGVAGGLYLGTPVDLSVALTNLGNLITYLRLRKAIL